MLRPSTVQPSGVAALNFTTVSSCDRLVIGITRARGGTFDLLHDDDVLDLVQVTVVASLDKSDHSNVSRKVQNVSVNNN